MENRDCKNIFKLTFLQCDMTSCLISRALSGLADKPAPCLLLDGSGVLTQTVQKGQWEMLDAEHF